MINSFPIYWTDAIDVLLISFFIYWALLLFRQTKSSFVVLGIVLFGLIYFLADFFNLTLTLALYRFLFGVVVIGFIVIFQKELRRFFELIVIEFFLLGGWSFGRSAARQTTAAVVENIVHVAERLAQQKIGMLVVMRGREQVENLFLQQGFELQGRVSEPLLQSIFDPSTPGHDGAVVLEGDLITRFAVHLPLSEDFQQIRQYGTRHSAALGIAEKSDALSIVVSEERGTMAIARNSKLIPIADGARLEKEIHDFLKDRFLPKPRLTFWEIHLQEKLLAFLIAVLLWYIVVYQGR